MAKLYFYYASMNAGKSTALLQADFNYRERGMRTALFTAALDDRHAAATIHSRIGLCAPARTFASDTDLLGEIGATLPLDCVLVDEAQFLTRRQVLALAEVCDRCRVPVLCYGLRTDFQGELFAGSAALLGIADVLAELKSVCECGAKATMTLRIDARGAAETAGAQTEIGGNDRYVALCRRHWRERTGG